jgi:hypothetical protein
MHSTRAPTLRPHGFTVPCMGNRGKCHRKLFQHRLHCGSYFSVSWTSSRGQPTRSSPPALRFAQCSPWKTFHVTKCHTQHRTALVGARHRWEMKKLPLCLSTTLLSHMGWSTRISTHDVAAQQLRNIALNTHFGKLTESALLAVRLMNEVH